MVHLQRIVLGPYLLLDDDDHSIVEDLFNRVVFPLLDELLKPQVLMRDPMSIPETRLRACALLCKAFMHFEAREGQRADIRVLWIQVLDLLDRLMNIDRRDQLVRASWIKALLARLTRTLTERGSPRITQEHHSGHECYWAVGSTW